MADISATYRNLSSTESSNSPSGATAVGTGVDDNMRMLGALQAAARDATGWGGLKLTSVAGTNTITGSVANQGSVTVAPNAYSTGMRFHFIPAATNTGATTLNVDSIGAKNIFLNGAALVGEELRINVPVVVEYDGTQFHIIGNGLEVRPTLATEQATTSGTSIDFTSIPSWVKRITIQLAGVSTNGSSIPMVQLGDAGGVETAGYLGGATTASAGGNSTSNGTTGFLFGGVHDAAYVMHGTMVLTLEDAANFTWVAAVCGATSDAARSFNGGGSKSTSAALDRVRLTTVNGTDTFDAGAVNIIYE